MRIKRTLEEFKQIFYDKFPNSNIEILSFETDKKYYVLVKNKYGICEIQNSHLLTGRIPSISSAINKTEYFINQAREIHGDKYDYSLVKIIKTYDKMKVKIICKKHGVFEQRTDMHLQNQGCPKCGKLKHDNSLKCTKEKFIEKANIKHSNKYTYDLTNYINLSTKIDIICPIHGIFKQIPNSHLSGKGCFKCRNIKIRNYNSENPVGWNKTNWFKKAQKSKYYDSFKVYIFRMLG